MIPVPGINGMGARNCACCALALALCTGVQSHNLSSLGFLAPPRGLSWAPRPRVVLFIHVPKAGGTTVRGIFRYHNWTMTLWSLSQRYTGWKANRLLHSIHMNLGLNRTRIFVEWHLDYNLSMVPEIHHYVRIMRPDVVFRSFIILRDPLEFLRSNGAYWTPGRPAEMFLKEHPEHLIFGALRVSVSSNSSNGTALCLLPSSRDLCDDIVRYEKHVRWKKEHKAAIRAGMAPVASENITTSLEESESAEASAIQRGGRLETIARGGCAPVQGEALHLLAMLDGVLFLEDRSTMQTVGKMAATPHSSGALLPPMSSLPSTKSSLVNRRPYDLPDAKALARKENACSIELYARLKAAGGRTVSFS